MVLIYIAPAQFVVDSTVTVSDAQHLTQSDIRRFKSNYGVTQFICSEIWTIVNDVLPEDSKPKHLLQCLRFLKTYATESVSICAEGNPTENTYQKWVWRFIEYVSNMPLVSTIFLIQNTNHKYFKSSSKLTLSHHPEKIKLDERHEGMDFKSCFISVGGTDVLIVEPSPFSPSWYSYKLNGPVLRYKVGLSLSKNEIMQINGPFQPENTLAFKYFGVVYAIIQLMEKRFVPTEFTMIVDVCKMGDI